MIFKFVKFTIQRGAVGLDQPGPWLDPHDSADVTTVKDGMLEISYVYGRKKCFPTSHS